MSIVGASSSARPVGHQGVRVDIKQRRALAINGWLGVVVLAGCVAGMVVAAQHDTRICGCLWWFSSS